MKNWKSKSKFFHYFLNLFRKTSLNYTNQQKKLKQIVCVPRNQILLVGEKIDFSRKYTPRNYTLINY